MASSDRKVNSYIIKAGKSLLYATKDTLKDWNPVITSFASDAKDTVQESYASIKSFLFDKNENGENTIDQGKSIVKSVWKNTWDDLKSGNWYNSSRDDQMAEAMGYGMDFDSFDFGDEDWDSDEWGENDDDDISDDSKAEIDNDTKNTRTTIAAMDAVGAGVSGAITRATTTSANYIVNSTNDMMRSIHTLNKQGFSTVTNSIAGLHSSFNNFAEMISKPLSDHIRNSTEFFIKTETSINEIKDLLKGISENTKRVSATNSRGYNSKSDFYSMLGEGNGLSISRYKEFVTSQIKDSLSLLGSVGSLAGGKQGMVGIAKSQSLTKLGLQALIPAILGSNLKDAMDQFNKNLAAASVIGIKRLGKKASSNSSLGLFGDILDFIGSSLIPTDRLKTKLETKNYNKGPVAWDGIARKALTEVIPTYLSRILTSITGGKNVTYNYDSGKFVTEDSVRREWKTKDKDAAKRANSDFYDTVLGNIGDIGGGANTKKTKQMTAEFQTIMEQLFTEQSKRKDKNGKSYSIDSDDTLRKIGSENLSDSEINELTKTLGIKDADTLKAIKRALKTGKYNSLVTDLIIARANRSREISFDEESGNSVNASLFNNSNLLNGTAGFINSTGSKEITKSKANSNVGIDTDKNEVSDYKIERAKELNKEWTEKRKEIAKKIIPKDAKGIFRAPFEAVTTLLTDLNQSITNFLWDKDNGFFKSIKDGVKNFFSEIFGDKAKKAAEEKAKKGIDWAKAKVGASGFWQDSKSTLKDWWSSSKDAATGWYYGVDRYVPNAFDLDNAGGEEWTPDAGQFMDYSEGENARGAREITRTGLAVLSEGEMVVPSQYNPFYHGSNNKKDQIRRERRIKRSFLGNFAGGNPSALSYGRRKIINGKLYVYNGDKFVPATDKGFRAKAINKIREAKDKVVDSVSEIFDDGSEQRKKDLDAIKNMANIIDEKFDIKGSIKQGRGGVGAGALLGAGASAIFGLALGPIASAAVGAGVGLVAKSKGIQKLLFGDIEYDEKGNPIGRQGGLLPKKISTFVTKYAKSIGVGGLLGGVGGLITGHPAIDIILGASLGYAKKSGKVSKFLFGDEETEGVISKKLQDKMKKSALPAGIGAILGAMFIKPGGLVTKMALGAVAGLWTTTDKVKDYLFGKKDENGNRKKNGLLPLIKTKIIDHIDNTAKNFVTRAKGFLKNLGQTIKRKIQRIGDKLEERAAKAEAEANITNTGLRKIFLGEHGTLKSEILRGLGVGAKVPFLPLKAATLLPKGLVRLAGIPLGAIDRANQDANLLRGYTTYSNGKALSAEERIAERNRLETRRALNPFANNVSKTRGIRGFNNLDQAIVDIKNDPNMTDAQKIEAMQELSNQFDSAVGTRDKFDSTRDKAYTNLYEMMGKSNTYDAGMYRKVKRLMNRSIKGENVNIYSELESIGINNDDINTYADLILKSKRDANEARTGTEHFDAMSKRFGFEKDWQMSNAKGLIDTEIKNFEALNTKTPELKEEEKQTNILSIIKGYLGKIVKKVDPNFVLEDETENAISSPEEAAAQVIEDSTTNGESENANWDKVLKNRRKAYAKKVKAIRKGKHAALNDKELESIYNATISDSRYDYLKDKGGKETLANNIFKNPKTGEMQMVLGNDIIKVTKDSKGNLIPDLKDKHTRKEVEQNDAIEEAQLKEVNELGLEDNKSNPKEKKSSSLLGWLGSIFSGGGISSILNKLSTTVIGSAIVSGLSSFFNVAKGSFFTYLAGSLLTNVFANVEKAKGATNEQVEKIESAGSKLTSAATNAAWLKYVPVVGTSTAAAALIVGGTQAAADLASGTTETKDMDTNSGKLIDRFSETKNSYNLSSEGHKLSFEGISEFKEYCLNNPSALQWYKSHPDKFYIKLYNSDGELSDSIDGYILFSPESLTKNHNYVHMIKGSSNYAGWQKYSDVFFRIYDSTNNSIFSYFQLASDPKARNMFNFLGKNITYGALHSIYYSKDFDISKFKGSIDINYDVAKYDKGIGRNWMFYAYGCHIDLDNGIVISANTPYGFLTYPLGYNESGFKALGSNYEYTLKGTVAQMIGLDNYWKPANKNNYKKYLKGAGTFITPTKSNDSIYERTGTEQTFNSVEELAQSYNETHPGQYNIKESSSGYEIKYQDGFKLNAEKTENGIKTYGSQSGSGSGLQRFISNTGLTGDSAGLTASEKAEYLAYNPGTNINEITLGKYLTWKAAYILSKDTMDETIGKEELLYYASAKSASNKSNTSSLSDSNAELLQKNIVLHGEVTKREIKTGSGSYDTIYCYHEDGYITKLKQKSETSGSKTPTVVPAPNRGSFGTTAVGGLGSGLYGGSSFVSQYDPRYAKKHYGSSTIADNGCGPAVAAMMTSYYGKSSAMNNAISAGKRFANRAGTNSNYFLNYFRAKGIRSNATNSIKNIYKSLKNNNPVVLMGRDPSNTSKIHSPFGPNNHYVMATGLDSKGNVIINDPELSSPAVYSPDILNSTITGITTSGSNSGLRIGFRAGESKLTANDLRNINNGNTDGMAILVSIADAMVKLLAKISENTSYIEAISDNTDDINKISEMIEDVKNKANSTSKRKSNYHPAKSNATSMTSGADAMQSALLSLARG